MDEARRCQSRQYRTSMVVQSRNVVGKRQSYPFGFFAALPSNGFSYLAWTRLTSPVSGSLSKDVAVIGNGALKRPTVFPGARRK